VFQIIDELPAHVHLRPNRRVHRIQQQHNRRIGVPHCREVAERVGWQRRQFRQLPKVRLRHRMVLIHSANHLRIAFLAHVKIRRFEPRHWLPGLVCHQHIQQHLACGDLQRRHPRRSRLPARNLPSPSLCGRRTWLGLLSSRQASAAPRKYHICKDR
jgi:hypothetical protein